MTDTDQPTPAVAPAAVPGFDLNAFAAAFAALQNGNPLGAHQVQPEVRPVVDPTRGGRIVQVAEAAPYRFDGGMGAYDFSSDLMAWSRGQGEAGQRLNDFMAVAFDATVKSDVASLSPNIQRPDMFVDNLAYSTPIWDSIRKGTLADDRPFVLPKWNSASGYVADHVEGTEPSLGDYTTTSQTITPGAVSGKAKVTRETWDRGGSPQLSQLLWLEIQREWAEALEGKAEDLLTAASPTAINFSPGASGTAPVALGAQVNRELARLQFVRGGFRMRAFMTHVDLYMALASAVDSTGRPMYPALGATNASGTAGSYFADLNINGLVARPAWALGDTGQVSTSSYLYNPESVHGWATPPQRIDIPNIEVAHVYIGVWGYAATAITRLSDVREVTYDPWA